MTAHYRRIPLFGDVPRHFRANSRESELTFCTTFCQCEVRRSPRDPSYEASLPTFVSAVLLARLTREKRQSRAAMGRRSGPLTAASWLRLKSHNGMGRRCGARPGCIRGRPVRILFESRPQFRGSAGATNRAVMEGHAGVGFCGFGSDFAEEPAAQGEEPVTQAESRPWVSSRTPYRASRSSCR